MDDNENVNVVFDSTIIDQNDELMVLEEEMDENDIYSHFF